MCVVCVRDLEVALQILDDSIEVCVGQESSSPVPKKPTRRKTIMSHLSLVFII